MWNSVALGTLLLIPLITPPSASEPTSPAFLLGLDVGLVDLSEAKVVDARTTLQLLDGVDGEKVQRVRSLSRLQINTHLFALSKIADKLAGVTSWPEPEVMRGLAGLKSTNLQTFMRSLRKTRRDEGWEDADAGREKAIQRVFDLYDEYGNVFRIKAD